MAVFVVESCRYYLTVLTRWMVFDMFYNLTEFHDAKTQLVFSLPIFPTTPLPLVRCAMDGGIIACLYTTVNPKEVKVRKMSG